MFLSISKKLGDLTFEITHVHACHITGCRYIYVAVDGLWLMWIYCCVGQFNRRVLNVNLTKHTGSCWL